MADVDNTLAHTTDAHDDAEQQPLPEPVSAADAEDVEPEPASAEESEPATPVDAEPEPAADADPAPSLTATLRYPAAEPTPSPSDEAPEEAPTATLEPPRLSDVTAAFAGWLRGSTRRLAQAAGAHRALVVLVALAGVAALLAGTLFALRASEMPPDDLIRSDAHEQLAAPPHTKSPYVADDPLVLSDVSITSKRASSSRDDACDVDLEVTFANANMQTTADATLTYVRAGDGWSCTAATTGNASHRALAGINPDLAISQLSALMRAAGSSEDESELLANLYQNAQTELVGENFNPDEQTDAMTLHCSAGTTFMSYECDLTARFRFVPASGAWELAEARVSDDAFDLGFQPLVGTWQGTFASQVSRQGKCLAARDAGLTVKISRTAVNSEGVALVEGTLSGVAHLHGETEADVSSSEGDEVLEDVPFAGTLRTGTEEPDLIALLLGEEEAEAPEGIVFDCVTQDHEGGTITLTLSFGTPDDPSAATATLVSEHPYQESFLVVFTYDATTRYEDTFTLQKAS